MPSVMNAMVAPNGGGGLVGPLVLIIIFLLLITGLVVGLRLVLVRLHGTRVRRRRPGGEVFRRGGVAALGKAPDSASRPQPGRQEGSDARLTGRVLKQRYLSGKISRAEYDEQLRRLQIEEFLEDGE